MNKKAELFQKFLDEQGINCFKVQEIPNDQLNTVVFRSTIEVEGQSLPTLVILDDSVYTMIRVSVANAALKEGNELELSRAINEINSHYKIFKYYFAKDGALILDSCIMSRINELDASLIYTALDVIVKHILAEYKNIMKKIWA